MFNRRLRFSRCVQLVVLIVAIIAFWGVGKLWTKPYAIYGRYPDGAKAWEQWERRTFAMRNEIFMTIRWYPDGELAAEWSAETGKIKLYGRHGDVYDGSDRTESAEWFRKYGDEIADSTQANERPLENFLRWWNRAP